ISSVYFVSVSTLHHYFIDSNTISTNNTESQYYLS
ncbi:unnamed protein product, partial [Heterotrigona itama]